MSLQDVINVDEEIAAYDALWDKAFNGSKDFLAKKSEEMKALYHAGLAEDFDPDTDPDLQ